MAGRSTFSPAPLLPRPVPAERFLVASDECRDFVGIGKMRGVGWAICYQDPGTGVTSNHWITLHEIGNVSGFIPILVMDVWEHAFILDYAPADRPKYIEAFFSNMNWQAVESRLGTKRSSPSAAA